MGTVLQRLSKDDLKDASEALVAQMPILVERNRTVVIRTLIERCAIRGVDPAPIADALAKAYSSPSGLFEITQLLKLGNPAADASAVNNKDGATKAQIASEKLHGSLLAQTMVNTPGPLSTLILDSCVRLGTALLIQTAKDQNASRALQAALTTPNASVITRRKIIQCYYGHIGEMALDPSASHVIDAIWTGTHGLAFIRERIAEELAENEAAMRESHVGRAVWRNWKMDMYKRRRRDWVLESRASAGNESFLPFPEEGEKARLKHAAARQQKDKDNATGPNAAKVKPRGKRAKEEEGATEENGVTSAAAAPIEQNHTNERRKKRKSVAG